MQPHGTYIGDGILPGLATGRLHVHDDHVEARQRVGAGRRAASRLPLAMGR